MTEIKIENHFPIDFCGTSLLWTTAIAIWCNLHISLIFLTWKLQPCFILSMGSTWKLLATWREKNSYLFTITSNQQKKRVNWSVMITTVIENSERDVWDVLFGIHEYLLNTKNIYLPLSRKLRVQVPGIRYSPVPALCLTTLEFLTIKKTEWITSDFEWAFPASSSTSHSLLCISFFMFMLIFM